MKHYNVYISEYSYKPEYKPPKTTGAESVGFHKTVLADTRLNALLKCLSDIRCELPKVQGKYLSVFVGEKYNPSAFANRLTPIQIVVATGEIREVVK